MQLTPTERDRLLLFSAAELARRRRAAGVLLNVPEATALVADAVCEAARDGARHAEALAAGRAALGVAEVLVEVADIVTRVTVEAVFDDGTRLVVVEEPIGPVPVRRTPRCRRGDGTGRGRFDRRDPSGRGEHRERADHGDQPLPLLRGQPAVALRPVGGVRPAPGRPAPAPHVRFEPGADHDVALVPDPGGAGGDRVLRSRRRPARRARRPGGRAGTGRGPAGSSTPGRHGDDPGPRRGRRRPSDRGSPATEVHGMTLDAQSRAGDLRARAGRPGAVLGDTGLVVRSRTARASPTTTSSCSASARPGATASACARCAPVESCDVVVTNVLVLDPVLGVRAASIGIRRGPDRRASAGPATPTPPTTSTSSSAPARSSSTARA